MKFYATLSTHRHVRRKDKDGADCSVIKITMETDYLPETGHALVDLTTGGALVCELKPVQREMPLDDKKGKS